MLLKQTKAFTLVELIVVITILAILWTLGFISYGSFLKWARNSNRLSDMKIIEKAMWLYITTEAIYPLPDNPIPINYSWSLAWTQGVIGTGVLNQINRISSVPVDPLVGAQYSLSVLNTRRSYSAASIKEEWLFAWNNPIIAESYALSSQGFRSLVIGNYLSYDVSLISENNCSVITAPSILLSDIPAGGNIIDGDSYNYTFFNSYNIPQSYSGLVDETASTESFQMVEILDVCTISSINQLKLYLAKLATNYQPFATKDKFSALVFMSNTREFQLTAAKLLQENGIKIESSVLNEIISPTPFEVFIDTFSDVSGSEIIGWHTTDDGVGAWIGQNAVAWDYTIENNKLRKNTSAISVISPDPFPLVTTPNYTMSFEVDNFWAWMISAYLRYTDLDNHYKLEVTQSGYVVKRRVWGVDSIFSNINDPISNGSTLNFWVQDDTITFWVNGIEKENIVAGWLNTQWFPALYLQNIGSEIDNYSLTYR